MKDFQVQFLAWLQGREPAPDASTRWLIYRDAYQGRAPLALGESLLERVGFLFGQDFVQRLLATYLQEEPAQHPIMAECLRGFSAWLRRKGWEDSHLVLCELVALSLARWDVLVGPDPDPNSATSVQSENDMHQLILQPNHSFLITGHPLHDLWQAADPDAGSTGERWIADTPQPLLIYKSSPIQLEMLVIPLTLTNLVFPLSRGLRLTEALDSFLESAPEPEALEKLPGLLAHLQSTRAFLKKM